MLSLVGKSIISSLCVRPKEIEAKETGWVRRLYEVNGYIKKKSEGAKGEKK